MDRRALSAAVGIGKVERQEQHKSKRTIGNLRPGLYYVSTGQFDSRVGALLGEPVETKIITRTYFGVVRHRNNQFESTTMEQRFSRGEQSTSSDSVSGMVNGDRRLLQTGFPPAVNSAALSSPPNLAPASNPPPNPPSRLQQLDLTVVIIMVVLVFALICATFVNSIMRCMLRRRTAARNARGVFIGRPEHDWEQGLDAKTLASLPVLTFKASESSKASQPTALECTICLSEFTEDERLRLLPKCSHIFHLDCIDMWLLSHISCPVCRAAITDEDGEAPAENGDESPDSGDVMLLVRDSAGNASVRRTSGVRITEGGLPGVLGAAAENLDVRAELTRDKSWNSLSDAARMSTSKRFISGSREGSMSRRFITAGSREGSMSRHSFRVAIDSILNAPDNFFSGRKSAAPSVSRLSADRAVSSATPEPHSPLELSTISSPNEKTSLAANDQLQVDRSPSPPPPEIK